jgi:HD superfamily phosphohydrolase
MKDDFRHKIIIDPVHGDIGLSKLETELIDTPTFQRLRGIKQLGLAYTVYPNARHSRFEHSLGVMHIMSRILESFRGKNRKAVSDDHFRKLRIAALLHDIGHYPYSHVMEKIDWGSTQRYMSRIDQSETEEISLTKEYPKHDRLGEIVITEREDIKENLKKNGIDPQEIVALVQGRHEEILNLLNASLDVDRLDYLMRDSLNTGLPYGKVDLNYIVNNLELVKENNERVIVVRAKARNSIEHMLMGRYFMFNTVYMHKTVFAFEEVIRRIVRILWEKGKIYKSGTEIEEMVRAGSDEFLDFHDGYLDKLIDKYAKDERDKKLAALCKAVKLRKPPKLVYEVSELTWDDSPPSEKYFILKRDLETKAKEFANDNKIKIPEEFWFFRDIKGPEFEKLHPFMSLAEAREFRESRDPVLRELVKIKERSGEITNLLEDKSSILHYMSRLKPKLCRIYALGIDDTKARQIRDKIEEWLESEAS